MRNVMVMYVVVLVSLAFAVVFGAFRSNDWAAATGSLKEIATTFVLPVVTLVLGYYFGREGRESSKT
jgi:hypothetical protein